MSVICEEDNERFTQNLKRLDKLLDAKFEGGTPTDNRDIRVAKEIIETSCSAMVAKTNLKIKAEMIEGSNNMNATIVAIVARAAADRANEHRPTGTSLALDDGTVKDFSPVPGQLETGHRKLEISDVVDKDNT